MSLFKRYHQNKQNASKSSRYKIMSFFLQSLFEQGCWVKLVLKFWDKGCWDFEIASGILLRLIDVKSNTWSITWYTWCEMANQTSRYSKCGRCNLSLLGHFESLIILSNIFVEMFWMNVSSCSHWNFNC